VSIEWVTLAVLTAALFSTIGLLATALFRLQGRFEALSAEVANLRVEVPQLRVEIANLCTDLADGLGSVRLELAEGLGGVRHEIADLRTELHDGLASVRQDLRSHIETAHQ
jgi:hypothetical protein